MATISGPDDGDLRPEYDLSQLRGGVRGKYYARYLSGPLRVVRLADDVAGAAADEAAVNAALREHLRGRSAEAAPTSHPPPDRTRRSDMTAFSGELLSGLRREMGLNRADFARMVGLSERPVATWEGGADLKESSLRTTVEVGRLHVKLRQSFASPDQLAAWLKTPNPAFGGSQPLQVIERGEIDRIWRMVYFLESGSPG